MALKSSRRVFIRQLAAAGLLAPFSLAGPPAKKLIDGKLRHAAIGVGGMGSADLSSLCSHPNIEIAALCDVDQRRLDQAAGNFKKARTYKDWRELLDKEGDRIDSVNVTTPDHMHAAIAMEALKMGKHVYCQKPLCHDIHEVRALCDEAARRPGQVTQMGIQIHSHEAYRMAVKVIRAGMIGKVKEVHSWCGKGWVGRKGDCERRPDRSDPVPDFLDWDLWIGNAPMRPFVNKIYHPGQWRRWIDFGTGTQGDMACHIMDPVFTALDLPHPFWVRSEQSAPFAETYSPENRIVHQFPATRFTVPGSIPYYWYDSGCWPDTSDWPLRIDASGKKTGLPGSGSMFIGTKGMMLLPHIGNPQLLPEKDFKDAVQEFQAMNKFPGISHYHQFVDAALGKGKASAPFGFSGRLTETVLMGAVANRFPRTRLAWNAGALKFTNEPEANRFIRRTYRKGWEVKGLS